MRWIEFQVDADREAVETVSELFGRIGQGGVAIEEQIIGHDEALGYALTGRSVRVSTYLPEGADAAAARRALEEALWHIRQIGPVGNLRVREVDEADWENAWKEHFQVHKIGSRIVIRPTWREYSALEGDVVVDLDPGMAFGTGLHPTTRLCLEALEETPLIGVEVLDVGTGSGILAIAAAKLGARHVLAIDVDPVAVFAAEKNVELNGAALPVDVWLGTIGAARPAWAGVAPETVQQAPVVNLVGRQFGLILANLVAHILIDLAPRFRPLLASGGQLLASGIIADRIEEVLQAFERNGLTISSQRSEGDWYLLQCTVSS